MGNDKLVQQVQYMFGFPEERVAAGLLNGSAMRQRGLRSHAMGRALF